MPSNLCQHLKTWRVMPVFECQIVARKQVLFWCNRLNLQLYRIQGVKSRTTVGKSSFRVTRKDFFGQKILKFDSYYRDLVINNDHISQMEQRLRAAIEKGLNKDTHKFASVKCFPTYVRDLPSGTEFGKFLALDLGGTNFRVVLIDIGPNEK